MSSPDVELRLAAVVGHLHDDPAKLAVRYLRTAPSERAVMQHWVLALAQLALDELVARRARTARLEVAANALLDQMAADAGDWTAAATRRYVELERALKP